MWVNKETVLSKSNNVNNNGMFFKGQAVQAKLQVNEPGDSFEKQADAVADHVMRMPGPSVNDTTFFKPALDAIQRKTHQYEEDDLHRKESSDTQPNGSHQLDNYVSSLSSSGKPLPTGSLQFFEPRFGYDFSKVRIHTDSVAAKSAQSINALAYTTGNNIVFNSGQYSPGSENGKKLMAHELTHGSSRSVLYSCPCFQQLPVPQGKCHQIPMWPFLLVGLNHQTILFYTNRSYPAYPTLGNQAKTHHYII